MKITKVLTAYATQDGDGVNIRRIPGFDGKYLDPFLMIDELKSDDESDYIGGFPPHPHRGIETFTYILKGGFEHKDQMGNTEAIRAGDVQWMSTGSGVMHSEMPLADAEQGLHGFQIWLNMPSAQKMREPQYQDTTEHPAPSFTNQQGISLKALAGTWQFESHQLAASLQNLAANGAIADVVLPAGEGLNLPALKQQKVMIYIHTGSLESAQGETFDAGKLLIVEPSSDICIRAEKAAGVLILAGDPLNQPIAHMGPFVMTTEAEIRQAVSDYQNGFFGSLS
ncbi:MULTISPECIES: pirin family protein [unclassified Pseudoalteromonas]|uniref:pirin family protein n=1 Tax=unclassified Pseudoalteromonas TaxID=194690 RepID=UPI00042315C9|nr:MULTISPECIES: pirin family protein [unclassified Pseudoalteromonas]TMS91717.1 pirin family protein [Pseudoalteromonas sp. S201]